MKGAKSRVSQGKFMSHNPGCKPLVQATKISKRYKGSQKDALKEVSLSLEIGRIVGLVGPNGAGKSTLIHLLSGVLRQSSGKIEYSRCETNHIAWVSQTTTLDWYLNVFDNVYLGARLRGFSCAQAREKTLQLLELLELSTYSNSFPDTLSMGQQKRIQIARALAFQPILIFLDEPTTGLDPLACIKLLEHLKGLASKDCSIFISSHDLTLLSDYVSDLIFIRDGSIVEQSPIESIHKPILERYKEVVGK